MGEQEQTGLMTCVSAEDYFNNIIRKHELTRKDKEMDRTRHVDILNANAGPVFLTYRAREDVNRLVERAMQAEPEYDFTASDGVRHTLYRIADSMMTEKLILIFGEIDFLYIADGHHRAASGATVSEWRKKKNPAHTGSEEYNFFLAVLFPHDQLKIMPYNRVVKDLNNLTEHEFLNRVQEKFEVIPAERTAPGEPRNIGMYLAGEWHMLRVKKGTYDTHDPVKSLDVSILMENLLDPVLGIKDPRTDKRIDFIGGIRGTGELEKLVNSGKFKVAFSMYPVTIEQLMNIADASKIMPPKSTWFEPKLRSGLVVHLLW
jgi:uncharacterized protein (DUF1015 family)